ncbi:Ubiquinone/menaquinone biosynthesis C-methylase UbiE [Roseateles sp. YR242]|uniref:class I SAM-dependent methyltransferase n=1 Tax=Roseateles sp. YR242 TaxID=1855305 RepID=UPI0008CB5EA6|nr:class I SAM-dependent methyltransferase [Roseateles sp. YR242]SEL53540.1 Ubiquinone/menaquinone biosynthesis C-methylase UbiE [Roseateles sp. YR242]
MNLTSAVTLPFEFSGAGPGAQSRDGCSVELYRRSAYAGEIEHLRPWLAPGTRVLELGCGTGLLSHRLLAFGCVVTGVDNSADMLAHVSDQVRRVHADIEQLALEDRFDVVLLPSGLINHADPAIRRAFVAAAARHVSPSGLLILKRQDPGWLTSAKVGQRSGSDAQSLEVLAVERAPDTEGVQVRMTLRYGIAGDSWTHTFSVIALEEPSIARLLAAEGFSVPEGLDDERLWFASRPPSSALAGSGL